MAKKMEESKRKRKRTHAKNKRLKLTSLVEIKDCGVVATKNRSLGDELMVESIKSDLQINVVKKKKGRKRRKKKSSKNDITEEKRMKLSRECSTSKRHDTGKKAKRTLSFEERLQNKMESGRFRWINEKLYTSSSKFASKLFEKDPPLFEVYHQGFSSQVQKWPVNPVDVMINWVKKRSSKHVIVDMGCGDAKIAQSVPNKVFSFDLVAVNKFVTVCDMAKVPLPDKSVHVVIYCLSLMGTNLTEFLIEARRILKNGGIMKVAEVVSRFDDMENFEEAVRLLGFSLLNKDTTNKMFVLFEFAKCSDRSNRTNISSLSLKPCLYKKR